MWTPETKSVKRTSLDNEQRLAKVLEFRCTPGSGNRDWPGSKGDGSHSFFMFECKETVKASIRVAAVDVKKLVDEAAVVGKAPALVMSAYGLPDPIPKDWVAVPASVFRFLLERLSED